MSRYEVALEISATVWVDDIEADSEEEAEEYAREVYRIGDAQCFEVVDADIKKYAEANEPQL